VKFPGNAAQSGLNSQDILLKIDGKEVRTLNDVKELHKASVANVAVKHRAVFSLLRNGELRQVVLDFSRDFEKE
jgi:S1-C subfamily serine protease